MFPILDQSPWQRFYAVAGRLLCVESCDLEAATLIERLFAGWQLSPVSFPKRNPDLKISFFCGESLPEIPPGLNQFETAQGGRCYTASDGYYLQFENSLLHLRNSDPVLVRLWVKQVCEVGGAELAHATSFAVCAALRRFGLFDLHSAGVVAPNSDAGVLIVGPSGSGKSTLTLNLAAAGWRYLSDDVLLLSLSEEEEVEARGFRSFFAVTQTANAASAASGAAAKTCFEPADLFSLPPVSQVVPRFLLFTLVGVEKKTELQCLTQTESMTRLIRACPWATYDSSVAGQNLEVLSRLARQATGFDLRAGRDLLEPHHASQIIGSACHA